MAGSGNWIGLGSRPLGDIAVSIQDETPQNLELAERPRGVDKDHTLKTHLAGDRVRLRPTGLDRFTCPVRWERQMHAPIRVDVGELASGEDDTGPHVGHAFVEPQAASPRNRDDRRPVLHACRLNARRNSSALTSATGVTPIWVCGIPCWVGGRGPARRRSGERWLFAGSIGGLHLSHCLARYPCAVGSVGLVRSAGWVRQNRHDASVAAGVSITGMRLSWRWLRWSEYRKGSGRDEPAHHGDPASGMRSASRPARPNRPIAADRGGCVQAARRCRGKLARLTEVSTA